MAPSRRKTVTTRANNPTRRIMTRSIYKKQLQEINLKPSNSSEEAVSAGVRSNNDTCKEEDDDEDKENKECYDVVCSTPRGKKYMIPKISTCPPAPKKNRLLLSSSSSSLTKTTTAKFFSHPDLDVLFLFSSPRNNVHA